MKSIIALNNQTVADLCVIATGGLSYLPEFCRINSITADQTPVIGKAYYYDYIENLNVVSALAQSTQQPATADTPATPVFPIEHLYAAGNGINISNTNIISADVDGETIVFNENGKLKAVADTDSAVAECKAYTDAADADLQTQINNNTDVLATILGKEQNETLADLQTKYNALATGYKTVYGALTKLISFLESTDAVDTTINKWKEIEDFLTGITDTDTLTGIIQNATAGLVSSSELSFEKTILTNNITLAQNGYANTTATIYKNAYAAFVKLDISASYSYAPTEPLLIDLGIKLREPQSLTVSFFDGNNKYCPLTVYNNGKVYPVYTINSGSYSVTFFALLDTSVS
jgi:hypothetical protein